MFRWIYALPLGKIILLMGAAILLWGSLRGRQLVRKWNAVNAALSAVSLMVILYVTLHRAAGVYTAVLRPFAALAAAKRQPELYREMLMNVFLFFPLGLTLSNALPQKWSRWRRIALTTTLGCMLSVGIEFAQYRYAIGMAETDDVLCNTLGTFLGSTSLLAVHNIGE